eukprot:CAMPEP_0178775838 /NCGR_PEP_ID=MMETSP0744-20121128/24407_1 /TAXON_ID=913974 /ORGANISM="Nitzschia punctata, Strain CCMP561" /LENGTH=34 /DNA_ID= /DNA_START= /DNA_END= /DNA_ORIENTATION=
MKDGVVEVFLPKQPLLEAEDAEDRDNVVPDTRAW